MRTIADILRIWPRSIDLARELRISPPRIADWKKRNSIPAAYWRELIEAAHRRGHPEITTDLLANLHARNPASGVGGFNEEERPFQHQVNAGGGALAHEEVGHFSRHRHIRRDNFKSGEAIEEHIRALREEWSHR
jgi:hypothetical protein